MISFKTTLLISITLMLILFFLGACNETFLQKAPENCTVSSYNDGALISCPDGTSTFVANGKDGTNGLDGQNGTNGTNGVDGTNGTNGTDGKDGQDATINGYTIVAILNPCGESHSVYDEIFLKLSNGQIVSSFSDKANGENTRFSILEPGNYVTTDGDKCYFTIDSNGNITNEHH